jgi:hypothetical protein
LRETDTTLIEHDEIAIGREILSQRTSDARAEALKNKRTWPPANENKRLTRRNSPGVENRDGQVDLALQRTRSVLRHCDKSAAQRLPFDLVRRWDEWAWRRDKRRRSRRWDCRDDRKAGQNKTEPFHGAHPFFYWAGA